MEKYMLICKFCCSERKNYNSFINHERMCKLNPDKQKSGFSSINNRIPWNKGLTKNSDSRVNDYSQKVSKALKGHTFNSTEEAKFRASINAKQNGFGGYTPNGGKGIKGRFKGFWCDSSWELAWIIFQLDKNLKFERNTKKFKYIFEEKEKNYIPDFYILETDSYIEVKGYYSKQFEAKLKWFPHKIQVFGLSEMRPILENVILRYGKDFTKLYEES